MNEMKERKISFSILIDPETKRELENLYPDSYNRSFSKFVEQIIKIGVAEYRFQDSPEGRDLYES